MFEYRVTKYDPAIRLSGETYDEWTSYGDVGATFNGIVLNRTTYEKVEAAYISVATAFLREADVGCLTVRGLEYQKGAKPPYAEGACVEDVAAIMTKVLREELWCRLEGHRGFIHFGWDYYMYIGVASACPEAQEWATKVGLFIEEMRSPYHPDVE